MVKHFDRLRIREQLEVIGTLYYFVSVIWFGVDLSVFLDV